MTGAGAWLSLAWVRAYTAGADQRAAARRAAEVAADIWEHERDGLANGRSRIAVDAEILSRCLRGAPADLSWRFQHRPRGGSGLMHTITRNALVAVTVLLAAWFFVLGFTSNFGEDSLSVWWILALIASGAAVLTGLWLMQRSPWTGCALLALGALPLGTITAWAIFPPLLALAAVALAIARARAQTRHPNQLEAA
jgi:hypothetical protein